MWCKRGGHSSGLIMGDTGKHLKLMAQMARAQNVDMAMARASGALSDAGFSRLFERCRRCKRADACTASLGAGVIPQGCANDADWEWLRAVTGM